MEPEKQHVWITTRRLEPGTRDEFSRAWRPTQFPEGMLHAFEYWADDRDEVVGVSVWESPRRSTAIAFPTSRRSGAGRWPRTSSRSIPVSTSGAS